MFVKTTRGLKTRKHSIKEKKYQNKIRSFLFNYYRTIDFFFQINMKINIYLYFFALMIHSMSTVYLYYQKMMVRVLFLILIHKTRQQPLTDLVRFTLY